MPFNLTTPIDEYREEYKNKINALSGEKILERIPLWKQNNLNARYSELLTKQFNNESFTPEDHDDWLLIESSWNWVKTIRSISNTANLALDSLESTEEIYNTFITFKTTIDPL